jgi:hypothetical protein
MPKRRITSARKAQIHAWQAAGSAARKAVARQQVGYSHPTGARGKAWPSPVRGSFGHVRRHKLGGKQYQKKSGGSATVAPEAKAILAGKAPFRDPMQAHAQMVKALSPSTNPVTGRYFPGIGAFKAKPKYTQSPKSPWFKGKVVH